MLESDARDDIIIETLDADYEDIESLNNLDQWSQRNALFEPISEATPTVLPTTVQRSATEPPSARVTLCLRSVPILKI